jgi:telomerase reverse transcriptase
MATQQNIYNGATAFDTQIHAHVPNENRDSLTDPSESNTLPSRKPSLMDYATPTAKVSAFCRSVLSTLIPDDFWGEGDTQTRNKSLFLKVVDRFITLRRFETVSLHDVVQGMKVCDIACLVDLPKPDI